MNLTKEKDKIKKDIDMIDDIKIINAIRKVLSEYEENETLPNLLNEPPLTDEEMANPGGRTPTKTQINEWLDRDNEDEMLSADDALAYSLKVFQENKAKGKQK